MIEVEHWDKGGSIVLAESASGVRVTVHPLENLVRPAPGPWPTPELLQKFNARGRFRGKTPEDDAAARSGLGYFCDLQSLNSEDALTWSVFGPLIYGSPVDRHTTCAGLFQLLGLPEPDTDVVIWLWRRIPHPEKPEANGGPEIDFGIMGSEVLLLGEAKWTSPLGSGQGITGNRDQLDLRASYLQSLAPQALQGHRTRVVLGVSPEGSLLDGRVPPPGIEMRSLSWSDVVEQLAGPTADSVRRYIAWRIEHARAGR